MSANSPVSSYRLGDLVVYNALNDNEKELILLEILRFAQDDGEFFCYSLFTITLR